MQLILCLLSNFYHNTFRASLCPSSGEQDRVLPRMVFCTVTRGKKKQYDVRAVVSLCGVTYLSPQKRTVSNTMCKECCTDLETREYNIIRRMRIACWITNATNTYSEYVILIAFPLQQWLCERASMLCYTYIA